mgnify:CR=1 FL=1
MLLCSHLMRICIFRLAWLHHTQAREYAEAEEKERAETQAEAKEKVSFSLS